MTAASFSCKMANQRSAVKDDELVNDIGTGQLQSFVISKEDGDLVHLHVCPPSSSDRITPNQNNGVTTLSVATPNDRNSCPDENLQLYPPIPYQDYLRELKTNIGITDTGGVMTAQQIQARKAKLTAQKAAYQAAIDSGNADPTLMNQRMVNLQSEMTNLDLQAAASDDAARAQKRLGTIVNSLGSPDKNTAILASVNGLNYNAALKPFTDRKAVNEGRLQIAQTVEWKEDLPDMPYTVAMAACKAQGFRLAGREQIRLFNVFINSTRSDNGAVVQQSAQAQAQAQGDTPVQKPKLHGVYWVGTFQDEYETFNKVGMVTTDAKSPNAGGYQSNDVLSFPVETTPFVNMYGTSVMNYDGDTSQDTGKFGWRNSFPISYNMDTGDWSPGSTPAVQSIFDDVGKVLCFRDTQGASAGLSSDAKPHWTWPRIYMYEGQFAQGRDPSTIWACRSRGPSVTNDDPTVVQSVPNSTMYVNFIAAADSSNTAARNTHLLCNSRQAETLAPGVAQCHINECTDCRNFETGQFAACGKGGLGSPTPYQK